MPLKRLHKDVQTRSVYGNNVFGRAVDYLFGTATAYFDRRKLARDFARAHPGTKVGFHEPFDPHVLDIVIDGHTVVKAEAHHDREEVFYEPGTPAARAIEEEALRHGYKPVA